MEIVGISKTCRVCDRKIVTAHHHGRGLCKRCYDRAWYRGVLHWFPLATCRRPHPGSTSRKHRVEDYTEFRQGIYERRYSLEEAARKVGVSTRTAERYERQLKQEGTKVSD